MTAWVLFDNFRLKQNNGNALNLAASGDTIKIAAITSAVAPTQATDTVFSAYTEVTGTNYAAGGVSITAGQSCLLAAGVITYKSSTGVTWTQSGAGFSNGRYIVIYGSVSGKLIGYFDPGATFGNVSGDVSVTGISTSILTSP